MTISCSYKTLMDFHCSSTIFREHFAHLYGTQQADQFVNRRMRREGSAVSGMSTVPTMADMHVFPSHPNMTGGRLTAPLMPGPVGHHLPTVVTVNLPTANDISVLGSEEYRPDDGILSRLRNRFKKNDSTKISFGHDVREALDHAARHGPHVQVRCQHWQVVPARTEIDYIVFSYPEIARFASNVRPCYRKIINALSVPIMGAGRKDSYRPREVRNNRNWAKRQRFSGTFEVSAGSDIFSIVGGGLDCIGICWSFALWNSTVCTVENLEMYQMW